MNASASLKCFKASITWLSINNLKFVLSFFPHMEPANSLFILFEMKSISILSESLTKSIESLSRWVRKLLNNSGQLYLSQAALETLSIISYKQPISKPDIESIRGVDCSGVLKTLLRKTLIMIKGRQDSPGRPLMYKTTNEFLQVFGLNRL